MSGRSFALGFAAALLLAAGVFLGVQLGQQKTAEAAPKAEARPLRAGYVCLSEVMKDYEKWQEKVKHMEEQRQKAAKELLRMRDVIEEYSKKLATADGEEKAKLEKEIREGRRKFDDTESELKAGLDKEAATHLKELYADISGLTEKIADERGLDVVYAYPAHPKRVFDQHKGREQQIIDLQLRATAITPLFLRDEVDLTSELVRRLNAKADREKK